VHDSKFSFKITTALVGVGVGYVTSSTKTKKVVLRKRWWWSSSLSVRFGRYNSADFQRRAKRETTQIFFCVWQKATTKNISERKRQKKERKKKEKGAGEFFFVVFRVLLV